MLSESFSSVKLQIYILEGCVGIIGGFYLKFWLSDNVLRWERAVQDDEDELETAKQSEQKQMADIDRDMRRLDVLKSERLAKKSEVDSMEDLIGKVCNFLL